MSEIEKKESELMKLCYDTCIECNWNSEKVFSKLKLFSKDIKKYAYKYITEVKKEKISKESFWFFIDVSTKHIIQSYKKIIKLMFQEKKISYEQIQDPIWVQQNLREDIAKFCYDVIMKFNSCYDDVETYCDSVGIDYNQVIRLGREYKKENASLVEKEKIRDVMYEHARKKRINQLKNSPSGYALTFNKLLNASSDLEIIDIINNCDQEFSLLKGNLSNYIIVYQDGLKGIKEQLEKKLDVYTKYLVEIKIQDKEEQRKEEEIQKREKALRKLAVVQPIINQFLEGNYEKINDFCVETKIPVDKFNECVELIKEYDSELCKKYTSYMASKQSKRFIILFTTAKKIIEMIKTGIDNNGVKREFDLVDYYEYTKLSFDELLNITKGKLSPEDYKALRIFITKNKNDREMTTYDIANLYKNKVVVGVEFDKFGKVIPNTGREITLEEKKNIIGYLKRKNIPVTNKTYNIIYRRWLAGELVIEKEDENRPKKI